MEGGGEGRKEHGTGCGGGGEEGAWDRVWGGGGRSMGQGVGGGRKEHGTGGVCVGGGEKNTAQGVREGGYSVYIYQVHCI